jgi:hypothetical protein
MPGFDKTGPRGEGPMTGGGFGICTGRVSAEDASRLGRGYARGMGRGFGGGRGMAWRHGGRGYGRGMAWDVGRGYARSDVGGAPASASEDARATIEDLTQRIRDLEAKLAERDK